jgi:hypothetical protein
MSFSLSRHDSVAFQKEDNELSDWQIEMGDIIAEVAANLVRRHGTDNRGILVLAEFQGGVGYSAFVGRRKFVEYIFVDEYELENVDLLNEFRLIPPLSKCPIAIEIFIKGEKISSELIYPEDVDEDKFVFHEPEEFVVSYFGDYPIKYPDAPIHEWPLPTFGDDS